MVKSVIDDIVTYYPSGMYQEKTDGVHTNVRKYYSFGSTTVAMNDNGRIIWLLQDQLNSTSVTADVNGNFLAETRYSAFGEIRYTDGLTVTDKLYTGQQQETELGLDYYVARFYDPQIAHFVRAAQGAQQESPRGRRLESAVSGTLLGSIPLNSHKSPQKVGTFSNQIPKYLQN